MNKNEFNRWIRDVINAQATLSIEDAKAKAKKRDVRDFKIVRKIL